MNRPVDTPACVCYNLSTFSSSEEATDFKKLSIFAIFVFCWRYSPVLL